MKFSTTAKFPYTGDYYRYTTVTSGTSTTKVFSPVPEKIKFTMTVNLALGGAVTWNGSDLGAVFIDTLSKLQIDGVVKNILDSKGKQMFDGGGEWKITMSAPFLGPNGVQEGYKYRLAQTVGNL
jgi:hypothetical protein